MRTKSQREALSCMAEEAAELAAAAARLNNRGHKKQALWDDLDKQYGDVRAVMSEIREWQR